MVCSYIQYGGAKEICKMDGNIDSAKYQQILASQYIPNYKRGQIFQQDGTPYLRFHYEVSQGEEDQGPSGMASLQILILLSMLAVIFTDDTE